LKIHFMPLLLPRGCHAKRESQEFEGMNRDLAPMQACVVTAGSRDG
jgi:hypothetical protein